MRFYSNHEQETITFLDFLSTRMNVFFYIYSSIYDMHYKHIRHFKRKYLFMCVCFYSILITLKTNELQNYVLTGHIKGHARR